MMSLCRQIENNPTSEFEYIISPDFNAIQKSRFFKGKTAKWKNITFQLLYFLRKQFVLPFLSVFHKVDIVFSPDIMSPIFAHGKKVSVIYDTFFWDTPKHYQRHWLKYFLFFLKKGLDAKSSIVTITEFSKDRIHQLGLFGDIPIFAIHPASDLKPDISVNSIKPPFDYFLHVGVMEKRKNLKMLVKSFSDLVREEQFGQLKLVLVGQRGPRESMDDYDSIRDLVRELGLEEKVIFPGYVSMEELRGYFKNALCYVFPSSNEGFGLPVLEAFSFGLPVIISNQGALKEVAGDAGFVLEENSSLALHQAMKTVLLDPAFRHSLAEKGKLRLTEFSTDKFFLLLEKAFKEIVNG
jgi:glycosyltransferase involved in cell wall biosynthesis